MTASGTRQLVYRLRLLAIDCDDDDDVIRRLRALLKVLLRRYRFRVIEIEQERNQPIKDGVTQ